MAGFFKRARQRGEPAMQNGPGSCSGIALSERIINAEYDPWCDHCVESVTGVGRHPSKVMAVVVDYKVQTREP